MNVIVVQNPSGFSIPTGGIILWYGNAASVPSGYEIYTELQGFFPYGGNALDLNPKGLAEHSHAYSATAIELKANHTHPVGGSVGGGAGGVDLGYWGGYGNASAMNHSHNVGGSTGSAGGHRHTLGNTGNASSLPAHKKLYYIRKI